ncbi:MAG TPA: hypothetical protein VFV32_13275 [Acidimicrobiales bacterium]|nr:hypothetical protein [Acidimicrobiales bacterium]
MAVRRSTVLAALAPSVLAASGLVACGDEAETSSSTTTSVALTQEEAIAAWVQAQGSGRYLGVCPSDFDATFPLDGVCSVALSTTAERSVQGLGPPFSEVTAFLLLEGGDGGWTVADTFVAPGPYDLTGAPDWLPDQPAGG